jgi:predicted esterase
MSSIDVADWAQPEGISALSVKTTAYYAVQIPNGGVNDDTRLLCVLHGWGQNGRSFLRRFSSLRDENLLIVAPQAPNQFYLDMETRKVGFSWLTTYDRNRAMGDIVDLIDGVLSEVCNELGVKTPPFMLGFSQGVSIAYRYHLLADRDVRGIVACGGDLPPDVREQVRSNDALDVLLVHGRDDGIIPFSKAEEADECLREAGHAPELLYFDGDHEIPKDVVGRIGAWVMARP